MKFLLFILLGFTLPGKSPDIYASDFTNRSLVTDTSVCNYFPLKIGNCWIYNYTSYQSGMTNGLGFSKYKIIDTLTVNNKLYYNISFSRIIISGNYFCESRSLSDNYYRIDTITGNIYKYENCGLSSEKYIDSLRSRLNDTAFICYSINRVKCIDTSYQDIFGMNKATKKFRMSYFENYNEQVYAMNIGLVSITSGALMSSCFLYLRGCVVNGVVYGDTGFIVGINQLSSEIPGKFSLSQNYPNPFNPATNIKFSIPKAGFVKLTVFDILGKEVQVLVNENLQPGTYSADWDAAAYPSGVYYYKLRVETSQRNVFKETKKMVLIK